MQYSDPHTDVCMLFQEVRQQEVESSNFQKENLSFKNKNVFTKNQDKNVGRVQQPEEAEGAKIPAH